MGFVKCWQDVCTCVCELWCNRYDPYIHAITTNRCVFIRGGEKRRADGDERLKLHHVSTRPPKLLKVLGGGGGGATNKLQGWEDSRENKREENKIKKKKKRERQK